MLRRGHRDALSGTTATRSQPLLVALAVLLGAGLVVVGLLVGAALGGSSVDASPEEGSVDAGFARDMQVHHGQAVQMSVLVRDRSDDPEVRGLALDILLTQQNQQGQMAGWLQTWGLRQSSTLAPMAWMSPFSDGTAGMEGMKAMDDATAGAVPAGESPMVAMGLATTAEVDALTAADGVDAERLYLKLMIDHHRGGVAMAQVAVEQATQPQARRLAEAMVVGQTSEIDRLTELLDARGGAAPG